VRQILLGQFQAHRLGWLLHEDNPYLGGTQMGNPEQFLREAWQRLRKAKNMQEIVKGAL
jgi:hypothetical protein